MFSEVAISEVHTVDEVAPGAPSIISVNQINNTSIEVEVLLPSTDSDGTPITGLTQLMLASSPMVEGENPFTGLTMDQILQLGNVITVPQVLTEAMAGTTITVTVPILALGNFQAIAVAVNDE